MPPRKKSRAGSSSSQGPSDEEIDRPTILARIAGLNVHFERGFQISALQTYSSTLDMLTAVGLRNMMDKPLEKANISLVREFYAGWEVDSDREFTTFSEIRGVRVIFDLSTIRNTLGLTEPHTDVPDYYHLASTLQPGTSEYNDMSMTLCGKVFTSSFGSGNLKPEYRLLNLFLNFDLKPTTAYTTITTHDIILLYWIATGRHFDIARVIFVWMRSSVEGVFDWARTQSGSRAQLLYPYFITRLCHRFFVPVFTEDRLEAGKGLLSDQTVRRSISGRDQSSSSGRAPPRRQPATYDQIYEQQIMMQRQINRMDGKMNYLTESIAYVMRELNRGRDDTAAPPPELHTFIPHDDEAGPSTAAATDDVDDDLSGDEQ